MASPIFGAFIAASPWRLAGQVKCAARGLFSALIDEPERRFSGEELSDMLGIPNGKHGVAGVLAWPGRHCFAVNRTWPWSWSYPEDGAPAVYWFSPTIAALFRQARDRHS